MPLRHDGGMLEIEIRHVRAFLAVVDEGGFTAAASRLPAHVDGQRGVAGRQGGGQVGA